jgi:rhamnopyranosyl-N-acetylglucosaminyl-diphospho-decaprenol beta-1,3/1,4-galactofuranosyltransferase
MKSESIFSVIVAYKDITEFIRCVVSLNNQVIPVHSIIVIDNSNTIDTQRAAQAFIPSNNVKTNYFQTEENIGSAGGFSLGMKKAYDEGAEWIWLHDEDDYPEADCLVKLLSSNEGYIRAPIIKDPETKKILNYFKRKKGWLGYMYPAPEDAETVDAAGTAGLLIHRKVIESVGIYDASFFVGFEDWDYCLNAAKKGFKIHVVPDAVVYHPDHQSFRNKFIKEKILRFLPPLFGFIRKGNARDNYSVKNIIILTKRHLPSYVLVLSLIFSFFSLPVIKIINRKIDIPLTLKAYFKSICAE